MIAVVSALLDGFGRRITYWGALITAIGIALWIAFRQGRCAAGADLAMRRAEARIRAMQTSQEIRHEVQNADRADLKRRAERWMHD